MSPRGVIYLLNLKFMVWRKLPEFLSRILYIFNVNIYICRWKEIRGVSTPPALATFVSTTTTSTTTAKDTTTAKYYSTTTSYSSCVDTKCLVLGIPLTCSSCNIIELAKNSTEQILELIESMFGNS